jgi:hypothetical protein
LLKRETVQAICDDSSRSWGRVILPTLRQTSALIEHVLNAFDADIFGNRV